LQSFVRGRKKKTAKSTKPAMFTILPPIPLEVFSTTNPYGPGHNWVKAKFIDVAPVGETYHITTVKVFSSGVEA
jgi:hypothetical protein